jgi:hypothetical protein
MTDHIHAIAEPAVAAFIALRPQASTETDSNTP